MTGPVIGVVGATGDVGRHVVRLLRGTGPVRQGSRGNGVDARDPAALATFAAGCAVLVNCAGPAHEIGDRVARAAALAGAAYVDVAGMDGVGPGVAVVGAGLQPGLTELVPRWAARGIAPVRALTAHLAVRDAFTPVAASDYLHAARTGAGTARAGWRAGAVVPGVLTRRSGVPVPFLPEPVTEVPVLTADAARLAAELGLDRGDWFTALTAEHVVRAFDRVHALEPAAAVAELCRASRLDLAGRDPSVTLVVRLEGARTRTAVLRGPGNGVLTGAFAAVTVRAVLAGEVPPGTHRAAEVLDPERAVARLVELGVPAPLVHDGAEAAIEEGVL